MKNKLTLSFIPYSDIARLKSIDRVKKILDIVLKDRIVILQGRLESTRGFFNTVNNGISWKS